MVTLIEVSMTDSPIADLFETMDGKYIPIPAKTAIVLIAIPGILSAILAKISTTLAAKPIEPERVNNYGLDGEKSQTCKGQPSENNAESCPLVAQHGEEQTQV
jgi:hypothetical protein